MSICSSGTMMRYEVITPIAILAHSVIISGAIAIRLRGDQGPEIRAQAVWFVKSGTTERRGRCGCLISSADEAAEAKTVPVRQ